MPTSIENAESMEGEAWKIPPPSQDRMLNTGVAVSSSVQPLRRTWCRLREVQIMRDWRFDPNPAEIRTVVVPSGG